MQGAETALGTVASVTELANVKGIGDKLLAKITPYVTASGKASPGTAGKSKN